MYRLKPSGATVMGWTLRGGAVANRPIGHSSKRPVGSLSQLVDGLRMSESQPVTTQTGMVGARLAFTILAVFPSPARRNWSTGTFRSRGKSLGGTVASRESAWPRVSLRRRRRSARRTADTTHRLWRGGGAPPGGARAGRPDPRREPALPLPRDRQAAAHRTGDPGTALPPGHTPRRRGAYRQP